VKNNDLKNFYGAFTFFFDVSKLPFVFIVCVHGLPNFHRRKKQSGYQVRNNTESSFESGGLLC